jgi:hypothetical protein
MMKLPVYFVHIPSAALTRMPQTQELISLWYGKQGMSEDLEEAMP